MRAPQDEDSVCGEMHQRWCRLCQQFSARRTLDDFNFCAHLYFSGMAETIRLLKLDMAAQTANLRERWHVAEVEIITSDGADIGWLQKSIQDDALYLEQIFIDAAFQVAASAPGSSID